MTATPVSPVHELSDDPELRSGHCLGNDGLLQITEAVASSRDIRNLQTVEMNYILDP